MNFSEALQYAKNGKRICREGWNGKRLWVRYFDPYKDDIWRIRFEQGKAGAGQWLPFLIMKTADDKIVPWVASQADLLAADWNVFT